MSEKQAVTHWQTFNNFAFLLKIYNISDELFDEFIFYLNRILSKHNYFDNDSDMSINDSSISFNCDRYIKSQKSQMIFTFLLKGMYQTLDT